MSKTITAFFEHYADAAQAVSRLETAGVPHRDISLIANNEGDRYSSHAKRTFDGTTHDYNDTHADDGAGTGATLGTLAGGGAGLLAGLGMLAVPGLGPVVAAGWLVSTLVGAGAGAALGGLAGALVGAGIPEHDAHAYAEGVRRGGALVTVRATDAEVDRIIDILDDEGTVDLDERQTAWRSEGWTGTTGSMAAGTSSGVMSGVGMSGSSSASAASTGRAAGERDQVIPIAEEELHVGKREVNRGRVRINSHIVERPVQEQVTLREENVHVERRAVEGSTRTGVAGTDGLFQERTIEMEEKREEAVVSKEARVKEELVIKKDVEQRTETVSDTVRSTEVTVEDERGNRVSGTSSTDRKI
jgi:uncharacterized protein (TIGR02271 family)